MDERKAWDLFWSYDRLASFGTGRGAGNYGQAIASGWRDFFAALPVGARVMDLATGNGAIAVMAVEAGDNLDVTGADLASVRPAAFVSKGKSALAKIRFLSDTPAEDLPLDGGSFDAVVSQYGIEYSDLERSVPEAVRILAPGGRLRFACHAAEGSVAADTKRAIKDADFLLDEVELTRHAATCIPAILNVERGRARGAFAQVEAQEQYRKFREALRLVAERARSAADADMLASVHRSLTDLFQQRKSHSESEIGSKVDALRLEVEAHRERERALLGAALSADEMGEMAERLDALGLRQIKQGEQRNGDALIGHVIEAVSFAV
ncbi:class I SAM-dependent methyltransferase [Sphingomonas alba]|uniref:Class I SAM-dependent methyltransferase n=1 Tax=Sphingomonas alba TaxID=2908208 RepID=A0ABT0RPN5_9SPHN|nr:class I SAM-dependent methyltransferase [Sphingomonas alba]MCL6684624.1 class I SAM-dependent methyltransferase [Sphingomonas alba]